MMKLRDQIVERLWEKELPEFCEAVKKVLDEDFEKQKDKKRAIAKEPQTTKQ